MNIEANKKTMLELINSIERPGKAGLMGFLDKSDFFIAPASQEHHLAVRGGLAQHSINVYDALKKLRLNTYQKSLKIPLYCVG